MRKIVLAAAFIAAAAMAGGVASADTAPAVPANSPPTAGWSNAEMQGQGIVGQRRTDQVLLVMREQAHVILADSARSPKWQA